MLLVMIMWVRGLLALNVGCEFRGRGSIPSVCQITVADLGQVGLFKPQPKRWPLSRLATRYARSPSSITPSLYNMIKRE